MRTRCKFCGREAEFWGGKTCDKCDADSDGINDRDEPIGSNATPLHSVVPVTAGFVVTSIGQPEAKLSRSLMSEDTFLRAMKILARRLKSNGKQDND